MSGQEVHNVDGRVLDPSYDRDDEIMTDLKTLVAARTPAVTLFGKSWELHVRDALRVSLEENLEMIEDSVSFLKSNVGEVLYDAEHFFDGFRHNGEYALTTLKAAVRGGASSRLGIPGAPQLDDLAFVVLYDFFAFYETGVAQPHFGAGREAEVALRRRFGEVLAFDPKLAGELEFAAPLPDNLREVLDRLEH